MDGVTWTKVSGWKPRTFFWVWLAFILLAYYGLFFTWWGNYFHGGGPVTKALLSAIVVLADYLSIEIFRREKGIWPKIVIAAIAGHCFSTLASTFTMQSSTSLLPN